MQHDMTLELRLHTFFFKRIEPVYRKGLENQVSEFLVSSVACHFSFQFNTRVLDFHICTNTRSIIYL